MDHRVKPGGDEIREPSIPKRAQSAEPHGTLAAFNRSTSKHHHIEGRNAVAQGDDGEKPRANAAYTSTLPSDFNQTLRLSLTKSLAQYYAPLEEITPQIRELLTR